MFGIDRQVYYRARSRVKINKDNATTVVALVQETRRLLPRLGTRKLYYKLREELEVLNVGRDKLFNILRANHLLIKPKRTYQITTNSHHRFRKHKNIIHNLKITKPNQVWVSDITYIGTRKKPCYLSLITDVYSKKIVGYDVSDSLALYSACKALKLAIRKNKGHLNQLIHHSDRGIQYCSNDYQDILKKMTIKCSMTNNGDPYENAVAERVNGILKQEFAIDTYNKELPIMKKIIKQVIETYNKFRPHWSNYMLTPNQMFNTENNPYRKYKKTVEN